MELLDKLIERVRRLTHEQKFTDSATLASQRGLQTQTFVDLFNEAHQTLHGLVYDTKAQVFIGTDTQNVTAGTATYTLPSDTFLGANVISVDYKFGDGSSEYYKLLRKTVHERDSATTGTPRYYIQYNNSIVLEPSPATSVTSGLRITYELKQRTLDVRRGLVSAVDDGSAPTSITVTSKSLLDIALASNVAGTYITIVDKDGAVQMKNIPVSSYDSSTGVITLDSFTPSSGEAVAVNDYVVIGSNASTHSPFPDFCEPYLVEYVKRSVLELNGHPALGTSENKLQQLMTQLITVWAAHHLDIDTIEEIDPDRYL